MRVKDALQLKVNTNQAGYCQSFSGLKEKRMQNTIPLQGQLQSQTCTLISPVLVSACQSFQWHEGDEGTRCHHTTSHLSGWLVLIPVSGP